ncbi:hypothetical protein [Symbioplanes lichenis]|uniref:hypothetical protein n=1 Tax=Symbioplanes lichenis TaxID=1629072 RepID=UPI002738E756|nr:hypothetical protein [Actinoplanes lichenis]
MSERVVELTRGRWRGLVRRVECVTISPRGDTRISIVITLAGEIIRSSERVYERQSDRDKALGRVADDFEAMGYRRARRAA